MAVDGYDHRRLRRRHGRRVRRVVRRPHRRRVATLAAIAGRPPAGPCSSSASGADGWRSRSPRRPGGQGRRRVAGDGGPAPSQARRRPGARRRRRHGRRPDLPPGPCVDRPRRLQHLLQPGVPRRTSARCLAASPIALVPPGRRSSSRRSCPRGRSGAEHRRAPRADQRRPRSCSVSRHDRDGADDHRVSTSS